jgi:hypothetical protein
LTRQAACTRSRPCPACGKRRPASGHDPCIESLPGVIYACCGHGIVDGYIQFTDGRTIRGRFTSIELPTALVVRLS